MTQTAPIDWSAYQVFIAVCEAGSISGAARRLGVNHSTVLRRVGALESALAVRLFERGGGVYQLSPAGKDVLAGLGGVAGRIHGSRAQVQGRDAEVRGDIRITTTDTLAQSMVMAILNEFGERYPEVTLRVSVNNHFLNLARHEADIAIRGSNRPPENLVGRHIGNIQTAPYASTAYLKSIGRRRMLGEMDWVGPDASLAHLEMAKWMRAHIDSDRVVMTVDSLVGLVHAVRHGVGAGMLLCPLADHHPDLVQLAPPSTELDTQIWILSHPDLRQVARIRVISQFLFERLSQDRRLRSREGSR